jgi:predicted protein tyrosine phosphatase
MKIFVVPRQYIKKEIEKNQNWILGKWIISIFSIGSYSPISDRFNVLKLNFDDISERDIDTNSHNEIFFDENHAKKIHEFIDNISENDAKPIYVHCDAGVSRSGAVGYILNEYFNKFITNNENDYKAFNVNNSHIMPNPLVVRLLKRELFGIPFAGISVNDYSYNEEGEIINHVEKI